MNTKHTVPTTPFVFLGGSCNPTTWRKDSAIPFFEQRGIAFFNPQIDDWYAEFEEQVERPAKDKADVVLMYVDGQTRGVASMIEAVSLAGQGRQVVVVLNDIEDGLDIRGQVVTGRELGDLNNGRHYCRAELSKFTDGNVTVCANLDEALEACAARLS